MKPTTVRETRATITTLLNADHATPIGSLRKMRGVLVPIPKHDHWDPSRKIQALHKAQALANRAFRELRERWESH